MIKDEKTEAARQSLNRALRLQEILHRNVSKECEVDLDPATGMLVVIVPKETPGIKSLLNKYMYENHLSFESIGPLCRGGTWRYYMPYC